MAFTRSNKFNADMNQDLLRLIESLQYEPYNVEAISGYRPGDPRFHGRGSALDVQLRDPKSGAALENYQDPSTFGAYQQYANALYQHALQNNPELAQQLRWGGYFSGGKGKYGALDLMHFDVGGGQGGTPMGGGSWNTGLNEAQANLWGLKPGGGVAQGPAMPAATYDYTPEQRRNAIAGIESAGSGDYKAMGPVISRSGDRAYGRYQVMGSNIPAWTKQALGVEMSPEQFLASPEAQDKVFDTIFGGYVKKHGEGNAATAWFAGEGNIGKDAKDQLGTSTTDYQSRYLKALGQPGTSTPTPAPMTAPVTNEPQDAVTAAAEPKGKVDKLGGALKSGLKGLGEMKAPVLGANGQAAQLPGTAPIPMESMPIVAGGATDERRNKMAQLMQRLNSGTLWG